MAWILFIFGTSSLTSWWALAKVERSLSSFGLLNNLPPLGLLPKHFHKVQPLEAQKLSFLKNIRVQLSAREIKSSFAYVSPVPKSHNFLRTCCHLIQFVYSWFRRSFNPYVALTYGSGLLWLIGKLQIQFLNLGRTKEGRKELRQMILIGQYTYGKNWWLIKILILENFDLQGA